MVLLDICDNKENIQQLKDEFGQANVVFILTDITKRDVVEQTFKRILERFQQIDIVVNCAGVACEKDLERTININLVSTTRRQALGFFIYHLRCSVLYSVQIGLINTSLIAMEAMSKEKAAPLWMFLPWQD